MIYRKALLADLKPQVAVVKKDLERQVDELFEVRERYTAEYGQARELGRTAASPKAWLDEQLTQVAVAWVLATVFVRFCEDNGLVTEPYLTSPDIDRRELAQARYDEYKSTAQDPTWRGWLLKAFEEIGEGEAGQLLFNQRHNPLYQVPLSHEGAGALVVFWGLRGEDGTLVHDFTDPLTEDEDGSQKGWGTRFLGDLYQDLSDDAQERYALLQTPKFVEEFILERTMTPALREFGFEGLKMIDPTCGSGHFVLGAFERLLKEWDAKATTADAHARVRAALDSVHGVDINPFAVAIARFRLLVAAMAAAGVHTMKKAAQYEWPVHLAVGDSLIKDRQLELTLDGKEAEDPLASFAYRTEDLREHPDILRPGRYHVVVGNPPYITVKDNELNQRYREMYSACHKEYALTVPFAQRFFELSKNGDPETGLGYGMVGQITGNSFIKREFGVKVIEEYFGHQVELTEVIDTSGAFIPGHGTPTVILVGRRRGGRHRAPMVRTVRSVQGEPGAPVNPARGHVWSAIVEQIEKPGSADRWVSVDDLDRKRYFAKHPWVLADGGREILNLLPDAREFTLKSRVGVIGRTTNSGSDDSFFVDGDAAVRRLGLEDKFRDIVTGTDVRDYVISPTAKIANPYADEANALPVAESDRLVSHFLWMNRTLLARRVIFGRKIADRAPWYVHLESYSKRLKKPLAITFAEVATHNHFVLDRGGKLFNQTAPAIKLREGATESGYLQLLGVLNSSMAAFWLKMVCHRKGGSGVGRGIQSEPWEERYQFNTSNLEDFPLPPVYPESLATDIDSLSQELAAHTPTAVAASGVPNATALHNAHSRYTHLRARLIALQEELDWQVYDLYNLLDEDLRPASRNGDDFADVPELALGQRAFEIVLARKVKAGEASDEWFRRHGSAPITEIPAEWPPAYREIVQKRIDAIEANRQIGMVERPEYKRRWATEGWDALQEKALRSWLLDRMEDHAHWFDAEGTPQIRTLNQLVSDLEQDEDFVAVAELFAPAEEFVKTVAGLLANQHVPATAALRYKPSGLDKRKDWEHAWAEQRKEDAEQDFLAKKKIRDAIPVPRPYTSTDVLRSSYWSLRGKLDVPKERFISYGAENVQSPHLYGWAGWDHLQQAEALLGHLHVHGHELPDEEWPPLLAALLELQPWLDQWHNEIDPTYGSSPAADVLDGRRSLQGGRHLTDEDLKAWRPPAPRRGRGTTARTTKSTKNATSTESTTQKTEKES